MESLLVQEAVKRFKGGFSCSQAIFSTYVQQYGMDEETAKTIARSFGGGMGRTCQTCGAVTGAYMVLGFKHADSEEKVAKDKTYALVQEFSQNFKELHRSVNCQELLGCDLGTTAGQDYFKSNQLNHQCENFVKDAGVILEKLL